MLRKITILFLLLFIGGCSVSDSTVADNKNKEIKGEQSNITDYGEIIDIAPELNPRELISDYLVSQRDFAWQTEGGGKNFCAFSPFNPINEAEVYLWVRCSGLSFENGALRELSGISVPTKLTNSGDNKFSHEIPRDGALYDDDLKQIFPKDIRDKMIEKKDMVLVNTNSDLVEKAKRYFGVEDFSKTPSSFIQHCQEDKDCITPFNYMIRSSCPYSSKCTDNKCEVVCEY